MSGLAWAKYGRQAQRDGDHDLSSFAFAIAIDAGENDASVWLGYGLALAQTNHAEQALAALKKSLEIDATQLDAWCILGELALDVQRYALAVQAFEHCHRLDPKAEKPHGARARALARKAFKTLAS